MPFLPAALLLLAASLRPIGAGRRPGVHPGLRRWLPLAVLGGLAHGQTEARAALADCRWARAPGDVRLEGWVREVEAPGRIRLRIDEGPCPGDVRVQGRLPSGLAEGVGLRVEGRWVPRLAATPGQDPFRAGVVAVRGGETLPFPPGLAPRLARIRAAGVARVEARFHREGPLVAALLFARRDGLDPTLRDAFAATGTAHLLAISGFHVGVLAGLVIWGVGRLAPPPRAYAAGAVAAWGYVAVLGLPDAATRAALLLTLAATGRVVGRPVSVAGALGTALVVLFLADPAVAGRIGAQLSFAGALGLALLARPWGVAAEGAWRRRFGEAPGPTVRGVLEAAVATAAATLATLPFVAWHFERVSVVALPASMGATPLVALALPAVLAALVLDALHLPGAVVAAAGAEGLLGATRLWVAAWAAVPGASLPVARPEVVAALAGAGVGWGIAHLRGVGGGVRAGVMVAGLAAGMLAGPVAVRMARDGSLEIHMFDVGQGDAFGIRTPAGRWVVVDAGPPTGHRLARDLRRAGASTVELLLLSHPDADHVGGAGVLLETLRVRGVAGPGTVRGEGPWRDAVEAARARGVPWRILARGDAFRIDGVVFRLLHPEPQERDDAMASPRDPNDASLVMEMTWRGAVVLFTGDAPAAVERALVGGLGPVDVLKVGHHGSRTSTDPALLERIRPAWALLSVGRGNRYGHPAPDVMDRLAAAGVEVWRSDEAGPVVVRIGPSGEIRVAAGR